VIYLVLSLANSNSRPTPSSAGNLSLWLVEDDENSFSKLTQEFKEIYPQYASKSIKVESFDDEYSYNKALTNAIIQGSAPDIFMLSNTEKSVLEYAASIIDPNKISPNDFRLNYKPVFSEDLIISDTNDASQEYVK
jgi:ABC-type glycerol-3-phosphate transport system substrate-binding protein